MKKALDSLFVLLMIVGLASTFFLCIALFSISATIISEFTGNETSSFFSKTTAYVLSLLDIKIDESNRNSYMNTIGNINNTVSVVVTIVVGLLPFFIAGWAYIRNKEFKDKIARSMVVREHPAENPVVERELMEHYYKNAQSVTVYAGDFSWISESELLASVVRSLASRGMIDLISSDSLSEVKSGLGDALFNTVKERIVYQNPEFLRCSLITYAGNSSTFLYRYWNPVSEKYFICAVRHLPESAYLLDVIRGLSHARRDLRVAVFVCGLPGAGKSLASNWLRAYGFQVVSAGDYFRHLAMAEGLPTDRQSMIKFGTSYLDTKGPEHLAQNLSERAGLASKVVFDGIRPPEVVNLLKRRFGINRVVYIDVAEQTSKLRLSDIKHESADSISAVYRSNMEMDVQVIKNVADITITNDGISINDFRQKFLEAIISRLSV